MWTKKNGLIFLSSEQKSENWRLNRLGIASASMIYALLGLSPYPNNTQEDAIDVVLGNKIVEQNIYMKEGCEYENVIANRYIKSGKMRGEFVETSLCPLLRDVDPEVTKKYGSMFDNPNHPNWHVCGSPDGLVYSKEGKLLNCVEIKFTRRLPKALTDKLNNKETNSKNYNHINPSHYMQFQTCGIITNSPEVDYLVGSAKLDYVPGTKADTYWERVPVDEKNWIENIYRPLVKVIVEKIQPKMSSELKSFHAKRVKEIMDLIKSDG